MEICGQCRGEGECNDDRDGWGICDQCGGEGYVDPYQEDEWYEDDSDGIAGQSYSLYLGKAKNGQLYMLEGVLTRYEGEDWGEASGWNEYPVQIGALLEDVRRRVIEYGKTLKPGDSHEVYWSDFDPDEDEYPPMAGTESDQANQLSDAVKTDARD